MAALGAMANVSRLDARSSRDLSKTECGALTFGKQPTRGPTDCADRSAGSARGYVAEWLSILPRLQKLSTKPRDDLTW
jgi:hypothetical protein